MHDLAIISKIQSITPIEGKDRIVLAKVENYDTIIQKDEFNVGDTVIYIFYDAILPEKPEFEFLRKRCWSAKWNGFRIRPMKMGGVVSEGLVLPISILPKGKKYKLGQIVTDELEIRYYDPDAQLEAQSKKRSKFLDYMFQYAWFRKFYRKFFKEARTKEGYPIWIDKSDEENIEKCYEDVSKYPETKYIVSEKMEGMAATFTIEKGKFKVYSHNFNVLAGAWVEVAKLYGLEKKLKTECQKKHLKNIAIQGEICGPNIQGNIYGFKTLQLFLYGGWHDDHTRMTWTELELLAKYLGTPTVPVLKRDQKIYELNQMVKDCEGESVFRNNNKPVPREGLVWRTEDGKIHWKNKSRAYKAWFDKKES